MKKQTQQILLVVSCVVLIISMFMPWMGRRRDTMSAFDIVFMSGSQGVEISLLTQLGLLLIPIAAGVILFYHFKKNGAYPFSSQLLFSIPAVGVLMFFFFIRSLIKQFGGGLFSRKTGFTDIVASGFWIALIASGMLLFLAFGLSLLNKPVTTASVTDPAPKI